MGQREQRKRKASSRVKSIDACAAAEARSNTWLDSLENDNHQAEQEAGLQDDDDDEYEQPSVVTTSDGDDEDAVIVPFGPAASKKRRSVRRRSNANTNANANGSHDSESVAIEKWNMSLTRMLLEEEGVQRPKSFVAYSQLLAKPSSRPPRKLCAVCGYHAPYTCSRCASRFCSLRCGDVHEQTQCLKMISN